MTDTIRAKKGQNKIQRIRTFPGESDFIVAKNGTIIDRATDTIISRGDGDINKVDFVGSQEGYSNLTNPGPGAPAPDPTPSPAPPPTSPVGPVIIPASNPSTRPAEQVPIGDTGPSLKPPATTGTPATDPPLSGGGTPVQVPLSPTGPSLTPMKDPGTPSPDNPVPAPVVVPIVTNTGGGPFGGGGGGGWGPQEGEATQAGILGGKSSLLILALLALGVVYAIAKNSNGKKAA